MALHADAGLSDCSPMAQAPPPMRWLQLLLWLMRYAASGALLRGLTAARSSGSRMPATTRGQPMRCQALLLAIAPLMVGCTTAATDGSAATPAAASRAGTAADAATQPVVTTSDGRSCLPLAQIRESRVIDDQTIDFHTVGGRIYRNRLPNPCPQLGFEKAFSYSTSLTQLCSLDIITVLVQAGGLQRGASCGLGPFTPYTPPAGGR